MTRVVVAGGGVAGVEALLALHDMAGDRAELVLVSDEPDFVYRPMLVAEPFGLDPAERRELAPLAQELGAELVSGRLAEVEAERGVIRLGDGAEVEFGELVVCVGGSLYDPYEGVTTFPSSSGSQLSVDELLTAAQGRGGDTVTFVVPPGVGWSLPLYELALMTRRRAAERGYRDLVVRLLSTEATPLAVFGPTASAEVAELLAARHIEFEGSVFVQQEEGALVREPSGDPVGEGEVVALARMTGPAIPGLPADDAGFIRTDEHGRVRGLEHVYAAGDGTSFPVKQGGLATQQADAAAAHIAHSLGAAVEADPFRPVLRGQLITGADSLNMRFDVAGGGGEGESSLDALWWPPHKISGRYLAPWLYHAEDVTGGPPPGARDIEVELSSEWHEQPLDWG